MSRLRKIEKGNDGNVPLNVFFFSFFFFHIFLLIPNYNNNNKKKKKKKKTTCKTASFSGFNGNGNSRGNRALN